MSLPAAGAPLQFRPAASAHLVSTRFGELYSGILHPLTTLEHLVPWLGIALVAGLQRADVARWVLLSFPAAVLLGVLSAGMLPGWEWPRWIAIFSMLVIGLLAAFGKSLGRGQLAGLCGLSGWVHGFANAAVDLSGNAWVLYCAGVALAAYLCVALGTATARAIGLTGDWGSVALRATGSWVAAVGLLYGGVLLLPA